MSAQARVLLTSPGVRWCQDSAQVLIVDECSNRALRLSGLGAALWGWFSLSYSYADVLTFTEAYLNLPRELAQAQLDEIIAQWVEIGLLAPEEASPASENAASEQEARP
jgi:hypothetical protein